MSRKSNNTQTSSTQNYYDNRSVVDAGGGIVGNGNFVDSSSAYSYSSFTDASDRSSRTSIDASQSFTDWSDRSTSLETSDSRDQSVKISTDGGAFDVIRSVADGLNKIGLAQTDAARAIAGQIDSVGGGAVDLALKAQQSAASFNENAANKAFDLARSSSTQAFSSSSEALGFAKETFGDVVGLARTVIDQAGDQAKSVASTANAAYASASDTSSGNKTLLYAGVAAVALVGIVAAFGAFRH